MHDLAKQQCCKNRNTVASRVYVADDIGILNDLLAVVRCHRAGESLIHGKEYEEQEQHDEILVLKQRRNCLFQRNFLLAVLIKHLYALTDTREAEQHRNRCQRSVNGGQHNPVALGIHAARHRIQDTGEEVGNQNIADRAHRHADNIDLGALVLIARHIGHCGRKRKLEHGIDHGQHQIIGDEHINDLCELANVLGDCHQQHCRNRIRDGHTQHPNAGASVFGTGAVYDETCRNIRNAVENLRNRDNHTDNGRRNVCNIGIEHRQQTGCDGKNDIG